MAGTETALIIGTGPGLSASLARLCAAEGMQVALAARNTEKLAELAKETKASVHRCDVTEPGEVAALFETLDGAAGTPDLVVFNPSARARGPITDIDPDAARQVAMVCCYGAFLVAQQAARRMIARGSGSLLFTGASASVKGYPNSSTFAMGKFGMRGLAQALARELQPQGIHVGHFVIDGGISRGNDERAAQRGPDGTLHPDEIAKTYLQFHRQHRSAWAWEIELRPWVEKF